MSLNRVLLGLVALALVAAGCSSSPKKVRHPTAGPIQAVINDHADDFKACYELEQIPMGDGNDPQGTVNVGFAIAMSGAVTQARVLSSTLKQPKVEACIVERLKALQFPRQPKAMETKFPFRFVSR